LRMIDELMHVTLHHPAAAGRVRVEPTARAHGDLRRLLHRLNREIAGRLDDDSPLAIDPGDDGWPVFVIMAPVRFALLVTSTCAASQRFLCQPLALAPCYRRYGRGHPLPPCLPVGGASHRRGPHSGATSTSSSWSGHGRPALGQPAATNTRDRGETSPESSATATAYCGGAGER